jgi:hypothetical protein
MRELIREFEALRGMVKGNPDWREDEVMEVLQDIAADAMLFHARLKGRKQRFDQNIQKVIETAAKNGKRHRIHGSGPLTSRFLSMA